MAQPVKCLLHKQEDWSPDAQHSDSKLGTATCACTPSAGEAKTGTPEITGQLVLLNH